MNTIPKEMTAHKVRIAQMLADGYASREVAGRLGISVAGIYAHQLQMMEIKKANNMAHLIAILFREKAIV